MGFVDSTVKINRPSNQLSNVRPTCICLVKEASDKVHLVVHLALALTFSLFWLNYAKLNKWNKYVVYLPERTCVEEHWLNHERFGNRWWRRWSATSQLREQSLFNWRKRQCFSEMVAKISHHNKLRIFIRFTLDVNCKWQSGSKPGKVSELDCLVKLN